MPTFPSSNVDTLVKSSFCSLRSQKPFYEHLNNERYYRFLDRSKEDKDAKTIIQEARKIKPDLYVLFDAVQYAPHGPIGVEEIGVDAYAFGSYKAYGFDSATASEHYNRKHRIRVSARVRDSYSTFPLEGLGWPDAVRFSAAHYNTLQEIDLFLKATRAFKSEK